MMQAQAALAELYVIYVEYLHYVESVHHVQRGRYVSPNKTLYIRDEDIPVWERAEATARRSGMSLSQLVTQALVKAEPPQVEPGGLEKIRVDVGDGGRMWAEGFTGRWLAWEEATEWRHGIAVTKGGQFAWYEAVPAASDGSLTVYPSLDDLYTGVQEQNWPDGEGSDNEHQLQGLADFRAMVATAAEEVKQEYVIWRDI
jgi:hypothetical protein